MGGWLAGLPGHSSGVLHPVAGGTTAPDLGQSQHTHEGGQGLCQHAGCCGEVHWYVLE